MNERIENLLHEIRGAQALITSGNWRRADELLTVANAQLNGIRHDVWLQYHRSGEGPKRD